MRSFAVASALALIGFAAAGHARVQSSATTSIEGRWTVSSEYLTGAIPHDLVISVDRDRIYGMAGDFQIRGTVSEGMFSFETNAAKPVTFTGTLEADGTLGGKARVTNCCASDGSSLTKVAPWAAKRTTAR
jgi:hypothetical protein